MIKYKLIIVGNIIVKSQVDFKIVQWQYEFYS